MGFFSSPGKSGPSNTDWLSEMGETDQRKITGKRSQMGFFRLRVNRGPVIQTDCLRWAKQTRRQRFHSDAMWCIENSSTFLFRVKQFNKNIIIFINCKWAVTRWHWLLCMYVNMKQGSKKFNSWRLHEMHAVATWSLGNHLSFHF